MADAKRRAFEAQFGFKADFEHTDSDPAVPNLEGSWPLLADTGDQVVLMNADGFVQDVLVYEDGDTSQNGWTGAAVEPYKIHSGTAVRGQIVYRKLDQSTGLPVLDTNSAADWAQSTDDVINGRKVRYPGWELERYFFTNRLTQTARITVAIAPDNAYEAILAHIEAAETSIQIESHTFENVTLAEALASAAQRGVAVTLLLEGSPPGGIEDQQKYNCQLVENAGGQCWFMINDSENSIYDRYSFLHAKFLLIDGRVAIVGSENLSPNSLPSDEKSDGTWGRRGAFIITDAPAVVEHIKTLFESDFAPANHADLFRYSAADPTYGPPSVGFIPITHTGGITYPTQFPSAATFQGAFEFEIIQAPENSLRDEDSLLGLIKRAGAGDTIFVQQLTERPHWGTGNITDPNPRLEAYLSAARRNAKVRLLLDSFFDDPNDPLSNSATCVYVNTIAKSEDLNLNCQVANPTGLGIHNKMILAEINGRGYAHIGSLNGTEQSNKGNRELALQVQSDEIYSLLAEMFELDWPSITYLPIIFEDYVGPPSYPLISEILYNPGGPDSAEFVELVNPAHFEMDLSNFSLSDAVLPTDFADLRRFPASTILAPQSTLVVAQQATGFMDKFGFNPDFEILETNAAVPNLIDDPGWGDTATFLQLGNGGDVVLLRDTADQLVDVVAYGAGALPGNVSCPLITDGHSLRRLPYWRDTDDCPSDFQAWPAPDPGTLP